MRVTIYLALAGAIAAAPLSAQAPAPPVPVTFASSAEVQALLARARREIKPGQPMFAAPLLDLAPYRASYEYRRGPTPAVAHVGDAEFIYVVAGGGTFVTGGTLVDEKPGPANRSGSGIAGGTARHLGPGDVFVVPQDVPHQTTAVDGELVMVTLKVPRR